MIPVRLTILLAVMSLSASARAADPAALEHFEKNVRPVLVEKCVSCHARKKQKSGLRLDTRDAVLKGGERGPGLVPGKPKQSILLRGAAHRRSLEDAADGQAAGSAKSRRAGEMGGTRRRRGPLK